ncbi:hypothetical protein ccbrp13_26950 [Ktedonobacteria bacterium brp13]|nr:hypothetical protein ccbrp13_26950 [Ktedonobacteria bacterium brp13]
MLQTLPLVLFVIMAEVSIGAVSVLVFLDWRNEVKRGFLVSYALIYLVLAGLTYWFQSDFATPSLLNTFPLLDKGWTVHLSLPLLLFFVLLAFYSFFLLLDKHAGIAEPATVAPAAVAVETYATVPETSTTEADAEVVSAEIPSSTSDAASAGVSHEEPAVRRGSTLRVLRLASGVVTVIAGLLTLLVIAMIFRPLAPTNLGGVFTVAGFFAAAFALGGVLTAMWLGHWYLVTPALSERPLQFSTTLVLVAVAAQVILFIATGTHSTSANHTTPSNVPAVTATATVKSSDPNLNNSVRPGNAPVVAPISAAGIGWLHILVGFVMPLVLGGLAWKLIRERSFQSATGMLYLVVVCTLAGEIIARGLFLSGLS